MLEETEGTYEEIGKQIRATGVALFGAKGYSRIVFTNGCFDVLHEGHLAILRRCRELAGMKGAVVVGLNSDRSVQRLKGPGRPVMPFNSRVMVVGSELGIPVVYAEMISDVSTSKIMNDYIQNTPCKVPNE